MKQKLYEILLWIVLLVYMILCILYITEISILAGYLFLITSIILIVYIAFRTFKEWNG